MHLNLLSGGAAKGLVAAMQPAFTAATGMAELSRTREPRSIGITQVSEIITTPGVELVGALPRGFELATVYSAAVCTKAREPDLAQRFAKLLAGPDAGAARTRAGFE